MEKFQMAKERLNTRKIKQQIFAHLRRYFDRPIFRQDN